MVMQCFMLWGAVCRVEDFLAISFSTPVIIYDWKIILFDWLE